MSFGIGEDETEIDFMLKKKEHQRFFFNMKAIPTERQHALVVTDIDMRKMRKVVRKTFAERRKITLLKDV